MYNVQIKTSEYIMTKAQYKTTFDKASEFYHANVVDGRIDRNVENYNNFKRACEALCASNENDIDVNDRYKFSALNKLFNVTSFDPDNLGF